MIAYRIKQLRNGRAKVRYMTPLDFIARLAALVPPPRHPLVRFHGVFAPRSSWRREVVPKPRERAHEHEVPIHKKQGTHHQARSSPAALVPFAERLTPNVLSVRHWTRLGAGALVASTPRLDWAKLMRRTFDTDVLECPRCDGRLRVIAVIEEPEVALSILAELNIPRARPPTRTRDPTTLFPLENEAS